MGAKTYKVKKQDISCLRMMENAKRVLLNKASYNLSKDAWILCCYFAVLGSYTLDHLHLMDCFTEPMLLFSFDMRLLFEWNNFSALLHSLYFLHDQILVKVSSSVLHCAISSCISIVHFLYLRSSLI